MQKQLSGGMVTGVLIVVGILVAVAAWKALAPPAAPPPAHITQQMMEAHAKSVKEIQADQLRRAAVANGSH